MASMPLRLSTILPPTVRGLPCRCIRKRATIVAVCPSLPCFSPQTDTGSGHLRMTSEQPSAARTRIKPFPTALISGVLAVGVCSAACAVVAYVVLVEPDVERVVRWRYTGQSIVAVATSLREKGYHCAVRSDREAPTEFFQEAFLDMDW